MKTPNPIIRYGSLDKLQKVERLLRVLQLIDLKGDAALTDVELKILSHFMALEAKYTFHRFSSVSRKIVQAKLEEQGNIKSTSININNRLYGALKKGGLIRDEDEQLSLKPSLQILLTKLENNDLVVTIDFISKGK